MAEQTDPVVAALEQEVTCGICHNSYQEPKLLPCCHYYCKQCILTLSSRYPPNRPFPCPDCREPTLLPDNNPDKLPTAFFINRMKEIHPRMAKAHGKLEATCETCSGGKIAVAFCRHCLEFICDCCMASHKTLKIFAGHKISTLEELKQGSVRELMTQNYDPPKCADHDEQKKIFCFDCHKLICRDCIVIEHAGHSYEFVKKVAPATRKNLSEHLKKNLELFLGTAQNMADFVERTLDNASDEELITMQKQMVSHINNKIVKRGKEAVRAHPIENANFGVEVFVDDYLMDLCESNIFVFPSVRGSGIKSAQVGKWAHFSIFSGSNKRQPRAILKSLVDGSFQQLKVAPSGKGMYNVHYNPKIRGQHHLLISVEDQPLPGTPFSVVIAPDPSKLNKPVMKIKGINPIYGTVNSSGELIVTDNASNDIVVFNKRGEKIRSISRSKYGFENVFGVAVDKFDNIYISDNYNHCLYKFSRRGNLQKKFGKYGSGPNEFNNPRGIAVAGDYLLVCDNGNKRIQLLTTQLEPVTKIVDTGLSYPCDIAVDDKQMLYIADYDKGVKVFTMDGQFSHCFKKEHLGSALGVFVDRGTGFVYVSDARNNCVSVFTRNGQFVVSFGKGHVEYLLGVTMDKNGFVSVCGQNAMTVF